MWLLLLEETTEVRQSFVSRDCDDSHFGCSPDYAFVHPLYPFCGKSWHLAVMLGVSNRWLAPFEALASQSNVKPSAARALQAPGLWSFFRVSGFPAQEAEKDKNIAGLLAVVFVFAFTTARESTAPRLGCQTLGWFHAGGRLKPLQRCRHPVQTRGKQPAVSGNTRRTRWTPVFASLEWPKQSWTQWSLSRSLDREGRTVPACNQRFLENFPEKTAKPFLGLFLRSGCGLFPDPFFALPIDVRTCWGAPIELLLLMSDCRSNRIFLETST